VDANGNDDREVRNDEENVRVPKVDLTGSIQIAEVVDRYGLSASVDTVAGVLGQSLKSGAFRTRMSAAGLFGLVDSRRGTVVPTPLGRRILDPTTRQAAMVEAFLNVDVFRNVYERFKGGRLPGDSNGLAEELRRLGVAAKKADQIRRVLRRSAEQAGFFHAGPDRLVLPSSTVVPGPASPQPQIEQEAAEADASALRPEHDPMINGALKVLPPKGETMSRAEIKRFLEAMRIIIEFYTGETTMTRHQRRRSRIVRITPAERLISCSLPGTCCARQRARPVAGALALTACAGPRL
jgi:hypothetical protein